MNTTTYRGAQYVIKPKGADLLFVGALPFFYLYVYMEVVRDHIEAKVQSRVSHDDYYDTLIVKMREKEAKVKEQHAPWHNDGTLDFIDSRYWQLLSGERPSIKGDTIQGECMRCIGDTTRKSVLPGSNYNGGLVVFQREVQFVQCSLPPVTKSGHPHEHGSLYMLVISDKMTVSVNGRVVSSCDYPGDDRIRKMVEEYTDMFDIDPAVFIEPEQHLDHIIDALWSLKPSGGKDWLTYKFMRCVELVREFDCRDRGIPYEPNVVQQRCIGIMQIDDALRQAFFKVSHAWVSYLLMKAESGTSEDYIKGFAGWCDEAYNQWKLHSRYHELPDCKLNLDNERATTQAKTLSEMMKRYATDVAAMTDERMVDVVTALHFIDFKNKE